MMRTASTVGCRRLLRLFQCLALMFALSALWSGAMPQRASAQAAEPPPEVLDSVSELRWRHRVMLVVAVDDTEEQTALLSEYTRDLDERDMLWFVFHDDGVATNFPGELSSAFRRTATERFGTADRVLLIGKDGGIKLRAPSLEPAIVFSLIDRMPMRQREMNQR